MKKLLRTFMGLRRNRWTLSVAAVLGLLLIGLSCTTRITPPAQVSDPVDVFLLDHGRTPSLVLPADDNCLVRYAYGDWNYYALRDTSLPSGLRALFWPSQGALGRRSLAGAPTAENVQHQVRVPIDHLYTIRVERRRVQSLHARLDAVFQQNAATLVDTPSVGLEFVHDSHSYSLLHTSNDAAAGWLRELGCTVRGPAIQSRWSVKSPR